MNFILLRITVGVDSGGGEGPTFTIVLAM